MWPKYLPIFSAAVGKKLLHQTSDHTGSVSQLLLHQTSDHTGSVSQLPAHHCLVSAISLNRQRFFKLTVAVPNTAQSLKTSIIFSTSPLQCYLQNIVQRKIIQESITEGGTNRPAR